MRMLLSAALLFVSFFAAAQDAPKPLTISLEPLGDRDGDVVAQIVFRFANPREITAAGLFLEGSFTQKGQVPRHFRFAVPRKGDKLIWNDTRSRNGKILRHTRGTALPDQHNEMTTIETFAEGEAEIDVRLVLEADYGGAPTLVAGATQTFLLAKTNRPYVVETVADDEPPEPATEAAGPVTIRGSRRDIASTVYTISVDVLAPVKRVEFWLDDRKVLARNAAPYFAELDLADAPKGVAVRAIGFDAAGRYVDADAFVMKDDQTPLLVRITRTDTRDGLTHFKLSIRKPLETRLKSVVLHAGDQQLHAFDGAPYTFSIPTSTLAGVDVIRATVIDESGNEASDVVRAKKR